MMTEEQKAAEVFRHRVPIQIRFNDVDGYGHVNNNAYFAYYDLGKESYLAEVLQKDFRTGKVVPVVANINANFLFPIFYGDNIVVETRVAHLGQKSFTLRQRAINEKTKMVVCECDTVMVCFSLKDQSSALIPEDFRQSIEAYEKGETQ